LKEQHAIWKTHSGEETIDLGRKLGAVLGKGDVIALAGGLGSGKTCFTKGVALGLGVSPDTVITSPSFALMNQYEGRCTLFHMDVYRLGSVSDFLDTGLDEYLYGDGVTVMEWADRWQEILPDWRLEVQFTILDAQIRRIIMSGWKPRALEIVGKLRHALE